MSLKLSPSTAISSLPWTGIRSSRSPSAMSLATSAPVRTGVTTSRVTIHATAPTRTTRTRAATSIERWTKSSVFCCSRRSPR